MRRLITSKRSTTAVLFNDDDGWGDVSQGFTRLAARVTKSIHQFEKIETKVKEYSKSNTRTKVVAIQTSHTYVSRNLQISSPFQQHISAYCH